MRRRAFITLLGGAVVCPVVTRAQQGERVRLIGILNILGKDDPEAQVRLTIFQEALKQLGWQGGRDFKIESRQVGGDIDRLRRYATELAALGPVSHALTFPGAFAPSGLLGGGTPDYPVAFYLLAFGISRVRYWLCLPERRKTHFTAINYLLECSVHRSLCSPAHVGRNGAS